MLLAVSAGVASGGLGMALAERAGVWPLLAAVAIPIPVTFGTLAALDGLRPRRADPGDARKALRDEARKHLLARIRQKKAHAWPGFDETREGYDRMRRQHRAVAQLGTRVSAADLERLDDATVDYLRVMRARLLLRERLSSLSADALERQLREVEARRAEADEADRERLDRALADLEDILVARRRIPAQEAAAAARLVVMAAAFDEIHHRAQSEPGGAEAEEFLRASAARLAIEADLSEATEAEVAALVRVRPGGV